MARGGLKRAQAKRRTDLHRLPSLQHESDQAGGFDVFISYSARDRAAVERVATALRKAGMRPWFDRWELTPGGRWQKEIAEGMRAAGSCAVFVGPDDLGAWEHQELDLAFDRAAKEIHFRVFPVLLPGVTEPFDPNGLPPFLSTRTWVDLRSGVRDRAAIQELINAVKGVPTRAESGAAPVRSICPYRGLQTFDIEHAELFFGREADTQRLIERLKASRFLAVVGPSGSGKSSLVRAGLIPALLRGALPGSDTWRIQAMKPGAEPLTALAAHLVDLFPRRAMHTTLDALARDERTLHLAAAQGMIRRPEEEKVLLVVDQLEEAFTLVRDPRQRERFFECLLHAAFAPGGRVVVVVTMRADFYPHCAAYPELSQHVTSNQVLVAQMEEEGLVSAVEGPASLVGLELEEGLTDTILHDVAGQPGTLPLLEHALLELWRHRRGRLMTLEAYRTIGGVEGSLARRADAIYEADTPEEKAATRRIMLRLTQPGEGTEDTRRRALLREIVGRAEARETARKVVRTLTDARLLTTGIDSATGERVVEVSHEALIRGWPRLRAWLDEDRAGLRIHRRLTEAAAEWLRLEHDDDALYRGSRLSEAMEWAERDRDALNELEEEFLGRSLELRERETRRRRQRLRAIVAALTAGIIALATVAAVAQAQKKRADAEALRANRESRRASSRAVAARAVSKLGIDPELGLLLAMEAVRIAPTDEAVAALRQSLLTPHPVAALAPLRATVHARFSPDGSHAAVSDTDGTVRLWDVDSGRVVARMKHADNAQWLAFSPDGELLVSTGLDGAARLWTVPDGSLVKVLQHADDGVFIDRPSWSPDGEVLFTPGNDATGKLWDRRGRLLHILRYDSALWWGDFSPDSRYIAAGDFSKTLKVWDVTSGRLVRELRGHNDEIQEVEFSPDGTHLATSSWDGTGRLWDLETGATVRELPHVPGAKADYINADFSPDGRRLLISGPSGIAKVWDVESGKLLRTLKGSSALTLDGSFSPNGQLIVTAGVDGAARIWEVATGRELATFRGKPAPLQEASFSPDGRFVLTAGANGARIWGVPPGAHEVLRGHPGGATSVTFSAEGDLIVSGGVDGTARVWDPATGRIVQVLGSHENYVEADLSPDGSLAVTTAPDLTSQGDNPKVWDVSTGRELSELRLPQRDPQGWCQGLTCIARDARFSPDGRIIATANEDGFVYLWDPATGEILKRFRMTRQGYFVAFSPDGRLLAAAGFDVVRVWEVGSEKRMKTLTLPSGSSIATWGAFSPDGRWIAVGTYDGALRIWNMETGRVVADLQHEAGVEGGGFSPDGRFLVTASDQAAHVWDLAASQEVAELRGAVGEVRWVEFAPNGSIVAAGADGRIRFVPCEVCGSLDELMSLARNQKPRDLTPAERRQFLP